MHFILKVIEALRTIRHHPATRGSGLAAMGNYCVRQLAARYAPGDLAVPFVNGTLLLLSPRMKGAAHYILPGLCEFRAMSFAAHLLRQGDVLADVGANVGAYALLGATAGAEVISLEPSPDTFRYLERNVRLNGLSHRVSPLNVAAGQEEGVLPFTEGLGMENHLCPIGPGATTVPVTVTTLDQALQGRAPTLLKVDVEGSEAQVLAGAKETLAAPTLLALIIERLGFGRRYGQSEEVLHERIRAFSFLPCHYRPEERHLGRSTPEAKGNVLYVRDFDAVQRRLREGARYEFRGLWF